MDRTAFGPATTFDKEVGSRRIEKSMSERQQQISGALEVYQKRLSIRNEL
jgi:hypothetical protein